MYDILISHEADKYYKKQDRDSKRRINKCIDNLSKEPLFGLHIKSCMANSRGNTDMKSVVSESFMKSTRKGKLLK